MGWKTVSRALGLFSLAMGAAELIAAKRIARTLDADGHQRLIRVFGAREMLAGVAILAAPAHATRVWTRVVGDGADLAALGLAVRRNPRHRATWRAVAFVVATTAIDVATAIGLDRGTGRTLAIGSRRAVAA